MKKNTNQNIQHKCEYCYKLIDKDDLMTFTIEDRNKKSIFNDGLEIQLHMNCAKELQIDPYWFDNDVCFDNKTGKYKYEEYVVNLIDALHPSTMEDILDMYADEDKSLDNKKEYEDIFDALFTLDTL